MSADKLIPRILITNDDGFDAPGLAVMAEAARQIAHDVFVVAPHEDKSGTGQSITLKAPLRLQARGEKDWSLDGTPADCVALGVAHLMKDAPPSLILSGVNSGWNIGDDANLSGTIGAALTGLMLGIPSIAVSIYRDKRRVSRWDTARAVLPELIAGFAREGWGADHCLSINLPDLPPEDIKGLCRTRPVRHTIKGFRVEKREDLRAKNYFWIYPDKDMSCEDPESDIAALQRGEISVSALTLDRSAPVAALPIANKKIANDE